MSCKSQESRLNEYVDGTLPLEERAGLERHLEGCASCRETLEGLRALLGEAAGLPRELAPPRDLWPEIRESLAAEPAARSAPPERLGAVGAWGRRAALAAAALLLVVASVSMTLLLTRGPEERAAVEPPVEEMVLPGLRVVELEYARATEELLALMEQNRDRLAPETMQVVERNLRIIDRAIQETRAALDQDPGNPHLGHFLTAMYQQKVEVLRRAARVSVRG
jgi:anti-sigma-K factor RskA